MRVGLHYPKLGVAALIAALGALGSGCHGDGLAFARSAQGVEAIVSPRLVFGEPVEGSEQAIDRWFPSSEATVATGVDEDGLSYVRVEAAAGGSVRTWPVFRPSFVGADRTAIHLRAPGATPDAPVEVELEFHDEEHHNRWWRVVTLADGDWQVLDTRLAWLRYDRGTLPRWKDVASWGLTFRTAGTVDVRRLELWQDRAAPWPYLGADELRVAFDPGAPVREARRGPFLLMTDAPDLQLDEVLDALETMRGRMKARFPGLSDPLGPVPLLVFADAAEYRRFWRAHSARMGVDVEPREEDAGYTWQGIATTSYSDRYGAVRPVYVHEASHALLERTLGLDAERSWLFEGLGNVDQLEVSRQDLAPVYRQGLARSDIKMPMAELISGRSIPTSRYWQATLLLEWLLADPGRTAALGAAMADMREQGSADLLPLLDRHFGLDLPEFSAAFWAWAWSTYARSPGT